MRTIEHYLEVFLNTIDTDRFYFYGISIMLIVLCHATAFTDYMQVFAPFACGYIGVDIFLYFSAYGCCYSLIKNDYQIYLKRRILRVYPLYAVFALILSIKYVIGGGNLNIIDWICNLTSLSYYGVGGIYIEWYICAILLIYALLPLIYKLVKKCRGLGFLLTTVLSVVLLSNIDFELHHKMLIGRLPMIYLGCLTYYLHKNVNNQYRSLKDIIIVLSTTIIAFIYVVSNGIQGCISVDMLSLYLLIALVESVFVVSKNRKFYDLISNLGQYSLEIYLGNMTTLALMPYIDYSPTYKTIAYFVLTTSLSFIYIRLNKIINMLITHKL